MTHKAASKLHNGDEVVRKADGASLRVVECTQIDHHAIGVGNKGCGHISIEAVDAANNRVVLTHKEVR